MSCPNAWVFLAQMVEHCSATAEAMGSNPIEVPRFFRVYLQLLKVARIIIIIMETLFVFLNVQLQISLRIGNLQMLLEIGLLKTKKQNKTKA